MASKLPKCSESCHTNSACWPRFWRTANQASWSQLLPGKTTTPNLMKWPVWGGEIQFYQKMASDRCVPARNERAMCVSTNNSWCLNAIGSLRRSSRTYNGNPGFSQDVRQDSNYEPYLAVSFLRLRHRRLRPASGAD